MGERPSLTQTHSASSTVIMASLKTCTFFESGTHAQFEFLLTKYEEALVAKAHSKSSKPETLIKLDKWYQNELPKKIKSRGNDKFLTHDEIVQTIKWKLARGQFRPRLKDLVQMNTPRVVMQETKKAFRQLAKKKDVKVSVDALCNLKGVGPAMASAVLAAGAPDMAPFMADECLLAMPDIEGIDYTMKEYLKLVEKTKETVERLNSQGGEWNPHKVELAIWTHYVARDIKPELLDDMPGSSRTVNGVSSSPAKPDATSTDSQSEKSCAVPVEEDSRDSGMAEESDPKPTHKDEPVVENGLSNGVDEESSNAATAEKNGDDTNGAVHPADNGVTAANGNGLTAANGNGVEAAEKVESTPAVQNGETAEAVKENGTEEAVQINGDATKEEEEVVKAPCSEKRSLEDDEDSDLPSSEAKRMKDDLPAPPPIPAGGD